MCCSYLCMFMQKTAYDMRISDWSADVCSSDLCLPNWRRESGWTSCDRRPGCRSRKREILTGECPAAGRDAQNAMDSSAFQYSSGKLGLESPFPSEESLDAHLPHRRHPDRHVGRLLFCRPGAGRRQGRGGSRRSEEHTSELQSLMRISYAVF